jgi:hypothetical protein
MMASHSGSYTGDSRLEGRPRADDVRQELGRIVRSAAFRDAFRLTSFLTFVVETTLAGRGDRLKAYTIAVEALGRGADFDPQTDPIVRVEAGRMRSALARYYAQAGGNDSLVIDVPRGTYVPTFRRRDIERATAQARAPRPTSAGVEVGVLAEMTGHRQRIARSVVVFNRLADVHRQQIAAMRTEIENTRQTLEISYGLLQLSVNRGIACRLAPPLLPTAPSVRVKEITPAQRKKRKGPGI